MMEGSPLFRAAGAYVQELAEEFGRLALQAAVLANMRMKDNNSYAPDPRIIPRNSRRLLMDLRRLWREARSIVPVAAAYMEDQQQMAFGEIEAITTWADPIPLARLAVGLRPLDADARLTLAFSALRAGQAALADSTLLAAHKMPFTSNDVQTRIRRNMACLAELRGDRAQALTHMKAAITLGPEDGLNQLSTIGLLVSSGSYGSVRSFLGRLSRSKTQHVSRGMIIRFLERAHTFPSVRLAEDPEMRRIVGEGLCLSEGILAVVP